MSRKRQKHKDLATVPAKPVPALASSLSEADRFDLLSIGVTLWDSLENLRRASPGATSVERVRELIEDHLQVLRRGAEALPPADQTALELVEDSLRERFALMYADYAVRQDRAERSVLQRILSRREGVAALAALLGLVTVAMPISTPLICFVLGVIGYSVVGPALEQSADVERDALLTRLAGEQERVDMARSGDADALLPLPTVQSALRPVFDNLRLAGVTDAAVYTAHARRYLDVLRGSFPDRGDYLDALEAAAVERYAPGYAAAAGRLIAVERGGWLARIFSNRISTAVLAALVAIPIAWAASKRTPLPVALDMLLTLGIFGAAGSVIPLLWAPGVRSLDAIDRGFEQEQLLLDMHNDSSVNVPPPAPGRQEGEDTDDGER